MDDTTYTLEFEKPLRELEKQLIALQQVSDETKVDVSQEIKAIESKLELLKSNIYSVVTRIIGKPRPSVNLSEALHTTTKHDGFHPFTPTIQVHAFHFISPDHRYTNLLWIVR